jgi:chromosome segregation ATPase
MLKKRRRSQSPDGPGYVEQTLSLLDEDHLEFEELLQHIQETTDNLTAKIQKLTEELAEFRAEALESRETIENLENKVDRLLGVVSDLRRDNKT